MGIRPSAIAASAASGRTEPALLSPGTLQAAFPSASLSRSFIVAVIAGCGDPDRPPQRHTPARTHRQPHSPAARRGRAGGRGGHAPRQPRPGSCWRSPNRRPSAFCWGRSWRARTSRAASPRCAISATPVSMVTPSCAMQSTRDASRGPRILASGRKIAQRGDYVVNLNPALAEHILSQEFLSVAGADQGRQAVRENAQYNVDVIKVAIEDNFAASELAAIVEEAHRQQLRVAAHAVTTNSIQTAIDAGVDSIEHGNRITNEQLKQMRARGIFLDITPTFFGDLGSMIHEVIVASPAARAADRERHHSRGHQQRCGDAGMAGPRRCRGGGPIRGPRGCRRRSAHVHH